MLMPCIDVCVFNYDQRWNLFTKTMSQWVRLCTIFKKLPEVVHMSDLSSEITEA